MPTPLESITELGSFADDYVRAGIETAEDLASLSVDEILMLDIGGIKSARAADHRQACIAATTKTKEPTVATTKAPAKIDNNDIMEHPELVCLTEAQRVRVAKYAAYAGIEDTAAWINGVVRRCKLQGNFEFFISRFANNLQASL